MSTLLHSRTAFRLTVALIAAFAVVVLHTGFRRGQRPRLEAWVETTAIGDTSYYKLDASLPLLTWKGQTLHPTSQEHYESRDSRMRRVGKDDSGTYFVYAYNGSKALDAHPGDTQRAGQSAYFLKLGPERFWKVQPGS